MKQVFPEKPVGWINRSTWIIALAYSTVAVALFFLLDLEAPRVLFGIAAFYLFLFLLLPLLHRFRPGAPIISLENDTLVIRRPGASCEDWRFPWRHVAKIEIHGPKGRRYWRVHLADSNIVDIPPLPDGWLNKAETEFVQREVAKRVPVVIKQTPTLFAEIRGDSE